MKLLATLTALTLLHSTFSTTNQHSSLKQPSRSQKLETTARAALLAKPAIEPIPATSDAVANAKLAAQLVERFFRLLSKTGTPTGQLGLSNGHDKQAIAAVKAVLDPALIVQRADGRYETFKTYTPIDIDEYSISDLHATRPSPELLAVRYKIKTPEAINLASGMIGSNDLSPRLSVFRWNPIVKEWLLISHASFNPPAAQMCNSPSANNHEENHRTEPSNDANTELAAKLIKRWYEDLHRDGIDLAGPQNLLLAKAQLVYGDGYGREGDSGYRKVKVSPTAVKNIVARSTGAILVFRFDALNRLHINDLAYSNQWQPRLVTATKDVNGQWRIASFSIFTYPQTPPKGSACRPPTSKASAHLNPN